jgi:hypothetical protein
MNQLALFEQNRGVSALEAQDIFVRMANQMRLWKTQPSIQLEFYRFVGINHTIRFRNEVLFVRLSDLFAEAPPEVIKALASILLSKLFRKRVPAPSIHLYRRYVNSIEMKEKSLITRSERGRKLLSKPQGRFYDLSNLFDALNKEYFQGEVSEVELGWSLRRSRRILGHFDPSHRSITVSKIFDAHQVPEMVVRYILFHEMLHAKFASSANDNLKTRHSRQFRLEEKKFVEYERANAWLARHL